MEMFNLHHGVIQIPVARMVKLSLLPTFKVLLLDSKSRLCKQRAGKNLHPLFLLNITDSFADTYSFFFGMYLLTPPPTPLVSAASRSFMNRHRKNLISVCLLHRLMILLQDASVWEAQAPRQPPVRLPGRRQPRFLHGWQPNFLLKQSLV